MTSGTQNLANRERKQNSGTTTPSSQLSSEPPGSQILRSKSANRERNQNSGPTTPSSQLSNEPPGSHTSKSKSALSRGPSRKEASRTENSNHIGHRDSAVSAVLSEIADGAKNSTKSAAHADSRVPSSSGANTQDTRRNSGSSSRVPSSSGDNIQDTRKNSGSSSRVPSSSGDNIQDTRNNSGSSSRVPSSSGDTDNIRDTGRTYGSSSKSNLHDPKHHTSAANELSSGHAERAKRSARPQPEISSAETNGRATGSSSVTVPSNASKTPGSGEAKRAGSGSLPHSAAKSSSLSARTGRKSAKKKVADSADKLKAKDVNLRGNRVPHRSEVQSSPVVPVEGTDVVGSNAMAGNISIANRFSSSVNTAQQPVATSSSEAVACEQASDVSDSAAGTASMDLMTSGKTIVTSQSNATSARTRPLNRSRQTSSTTHTASSSKAVASSNVSDAVSVAVMTSGKSSAANRSNAASSKTRSVTGGRQTTAAAVTASVSPAVR